MPRINDYGAPEVESQVPLEVSSQRIEEAGQFGRAVKEFGNQFSQLADIHYRRAAQEEVSNAQVQFATARADWSQKLNKQIQDGNVDVDQLKSDYQDFVEKNADQYETSHGQQIYQQQAARTGAMLTRNAVHAQAVLAGQKAKQNWNNALTNDSSTLYDNPENFQEVLESNHADIDAQVETGTVPAQRAAEMKDKVGIALAKASLKGWARTDPGKAQQLLDNGEFNKYLGGEMKDQMQTYVDARKRAQEADDLRSERLQKDAKKATGEKWKQDNFTKLENNALSVESVEKAVQDGILTYEDAKEQVGMIRANARQESKVDPRLYNSLTQKVADGTITDPAEIRKYAGRGLSIHATQEIVGLIDKTPEGQAINSQRKALYSAANSIRFLDPMTGHYSAIGETKLGQFKADLIRAEDAQRKANKPVGDLYDPNSADYFGKKMDKYTTPMAERFSTGTTQLQQQAITTPNGAPKSEDVRKPGETPSDWLKRTGRVK